MLFYSFHTIKFFWNLVTHEKYHEGELGFHTIKSFWNFKKGYRIMMQCFVSTLLSPSETLDTLLSQATANVFPHY